MDRRTGERRRRSPTGGGGAPPPPPFDPMSGSPSLYVKPTNYDEGTGIWTATAGNNLVSAGAAHPKGETGYAWMRGDYGTYLASPDDSDTVYGMGDHYFFMVVNLTDPITGAQPAAFAYGNDIAWSDGYTQYGLSFRVNAGTYYATYFEWPSAGVATAETTIGASTGTYVVQGKKVGGFLWIKVGSGPWVLGDACLDDAVATQPLFIGYGMAGLGVPEIIKAAGFYKTIPGGSFSSDIVTWAGTI